MLGCLCPVIMLSIPILIAYITAKALEPKDDDWWMDHTSAGDVTLILVCV